MARTPKYIQGPDELPPLWVSIGGLIFGTGATFVIVGILVVVLVGCVPGGGTPRLASANVITRWKIGAATWPPR